MFLCEVEVRIVWAPDGSGNTFLAQAQANIPGQGQTQQPHVGLFAQVRGYRVAEPVLGVGPGKEAAVTLANINAALTAAVFDFAGATGTPIITPAELAIIQGWPSGQP